LRKKLLKRLMSQKTQGQEAASPAVSRFASPAPVEERAELVSSHKRVPKTTNILHKYDILHSAEVDRGSSIAYLFLSGSTDKNSLA
jgi:hypothetical protein